MQRKRRHDAQDKRYLLVSMDAILAVVEWRGWHGNPVGVSGQEVGNTLPV